jgi:hypothetical protein
MSDTKTKTTLFSQDIPGGKIVVEFVPEGYEEPTKGVDAKLVKGVLTDIISDRLRGAISDEIESRLSCIQGTLNDAARAASSASEYAADCESSVESACGELDDDSAVDTVANGVGERLEKELPEMLREAEAAFAKAATPEPATEPASA